jgi:hypothetical protein
MKQAFLSAFSRLWPRLYAGQWVGNFLLMFLAAAWLQIPDSHTWQFGLAILSGALLVAGFFALYITTFRYLLPCPDRSAWWRSCLWLAFFMALWWLLVAWIGVGRAHESLYAGYWNAQSPRWLRYHLGYSALVAWQEHIYDCIQWVWAGLLLPLAMDICACGLRKGWLRRGSHVYRRWFYWLAVVLAAFAGEWITWTLADWTPEFGLIGQTTSLVARLGLAYSVDMLLWCFVLALAACYLEPVSETR